MGKLVNEIAIDAPIEKIWGILTDLELLDKTDPSVQKATAITSIKSGLDAARKVEMKDGKNWFIEKISTFKPQESLAYELTECTFLFMH